ncbi:MAG: MFS transporter [Deltaproteobacteria bacterium]|nr:MFS transporter [Deltaproteobacteria bacterium]
MTEQKSNRRDLAIIAFTAFLNFTGLTLAIPIFTPLCLDQTGGIIALGTSIPVRTTILGFLLGIFPLCQFFTSPLLGALSDRLGRKKILLFAIAGTCAGYILMAVSILIGSLPLAFLSRIITGGFSGSLAVTQSAIADLSNENSRAKNFGLLGAAFGTSLFIGPALGGFLSDPTINARFNFATPFWLAAFLTAVNFLQVAWQFCETLPPEKRRRAGFHLLVGPINIIRAFQSTAYRRMFLVVFALSFGFNFFTQFFQVFLIDQFAATPKQLGMMLSYLGIWSILTQAVFVRPISKRFAPVKILPVSLLLLAASFPALLMARDFWMLFPVIIFIPLFNGLSSPNLTAVVCGLGGDKSHGEILGINQSVMAMAQFLPPLIGGYIVGQHFTLPLWITSASVLLAWILFLRTQ